MSFNYKNPITPEQIKGAQSVGRSSTQGTNFSILGIGGFVEVYNLTDLIYTIPSGTTGPIQYSGNSLPITFTKGTGASFSPDVLTLNSDNISSGRRRLGMLAYVKELDQVYQFDIQNYETLWNAATGATGTGGNTVVFSDFGTTVSNNSVAGQNFINAWTGTSIEGYLGVTRATSNWKKFWGNNLSVTGGSFNISSGQLTLVNITGGSQNISGFNFLPISGGTVTGATNFTAGLTANAISATTYQNLPQSVSGSGTSNYIAKWTGSTGLGNSILTDDGSLVTIDGNLRVNGNTILGDSSGDTITLSASTIILGNGTGTLGVDTSTLYVDALNNRVGVNTSAPTVTFYVSGTSFVSSNFTAFRSSTLGSAANVSTDTILIYPSAITFSNLVQSATTATNRFLVTDSNGVLRYRSDVITTAGGTITGGTSFTGGLTATTISATTYQNLPIKYYAEFSGAPSTSPIVLGTDSISIGNGAESRSTYMLSFGTNAGKNATGTTVSTFIGNGAGYDASGSAYVNFIGPNAGYGAINANSSTFLNNASGNFSTGATYSNFFGTSAGESSKDLNYSNVLGYQAGLGVTNAQHVNYFGRQAGWYATNATLSNFIGFVAGTSATNAQNSNFIGTNAGTTATNASYSNFIGSNAGNSASNASYSNLIGFNAGKFFTSNNIGSNNIIIGTNISLPSGATNSINIGGVLFGTGAYSTTGGDPSIVSSNGKIGINVVSPVTTLDVDGTTRITGGLTASSITSTGVTTLGSGTFTKGGSGSGDVLLDNGSTDTPAVLMYYANNSNWGIDSNNQTFDVLSGQLFRVVNKLNETGGVVRMAIDTSGNMSVVGFVNPGAWRAGQTIKDTMLSNTEVTVNTTTIATSTSDTDFVTYSYTPTSSSSYLIIHYHLADYSFASGTGNDSYISRIKVDGSEITYSKQSTVNGNRSGVLFPLTGRYTNSSTSAKSIVVACRRDSADDSITIVNSSTSMWLRITEIAR